MHSRKKGKSGSSKPIGQSKPVWIRYKAKEVEVLVSKMAKDKKTAAQIGVELRDTYGIPSVKLTAGKSVSQILAARKQSPDIPDDMMALIKKALLIRKHNANYRKDNTAKRGLTLTESKIRRLVKYYQRTGRLAKTWAYDPEKMKLLVE